MVTRTCGKQFGGLMTISSLINWVARGTAVLSVGNYLSAMFPSLNPVVMALIVWGFLTIANLFGVDVMAKIQSFATPCLLICLFVFSGLCAFHVQPGYMDFTGPDMFTNGLTGWLSAVVLLNYSTNGHSLISNFAPRGRESEEKYPAVNDYYHRHYFLLIYSGWLCIRCGASSGSNSKRNFDGNGKISSPHVSLLCFYVWRTYFCFADHDEFRHYEFGHARACRC